VSIAILATPATVKSEAYPRFLATALNTPFVPGHFEKLTQPRWMPAKSPTIDSFAYRATLALGPKKRVIVYQLAPANWVEMIENGAPETEKRDAVRRDLGMLLGRTNEAARFDLVGEFCTHYPVFDAMIREEMQRLGKADAETPFIVQGPLMGELFRAQFLHHKPPKALGPVPAPPTPTFYMTGTNVDATRALARTIFPHDPEPRIEHREFAPRR
jgi:glutamate racemase